MQQTDKYKLNLIEKDDVFSPDALNDNMEKVEQAISAQAAAEAAARAADVAALDQRLQVFEARKFVIGHATNESKFMYLGFTPKLLYLQAGNNAHMLLFDGRSSYIGLRVENDGFHHDGAYESCHFIAFA